MANSKYSKVYIVIPAFNESTVIAKVISDIKNKGFKNIIVVDDGSNDDTYKIAKNYGCIVLKHLINRGKGAATQTGLDAAKILGAKVVVTMDGDGQHDASDIKKLVNPILNNKCEVTLGSRLVSKGMPISRKVMNVIANLITFLFYGVYVSDSQSGFRAYSSKANLYINTTMDRYEFESEVLAQIRAAKLKYIEIPINIHYTKYSRNKYNTVKDFQAQNILNGFKIVFKLVIRSIFS